MEKPFCPTCEREFDEGIKFCPHDATPLVIRSADAMTGKVFDGRYQILHKLGEGGMGAVYKAIQKSTGKPVAIKVVSRGLSDNPDTIRRFQREVKLQSQLEHPNVVNIIDFSKNEEGQYYFVMNFVEGKSLRRVILDDGKLSLEAFFELAEQALDALEYAHSRGIVHRDLKADNMVVVALAHQRIVKILDFGLAKAIQAGGPSMDTELTQEGRVLGTPAYMAPEQAMGELDKIGPWTDIYSMGVVFYQMLSGKLPFESDTPWGLMHKHISAKPQPLSEICPDVPEGVEIAIMRCLEKEPGARWGSAMAVKEALRKERYGAAPGKTEYDETEIAPPPIPGAAPARSRVPVIAGAVVVMAALTGLYFWKTGQVAEAPKVEAPVAAPAEEAPEPMEMTEAEPPTPEPEEVKEPEHAAAPPDEKKKQAVAAPAPAARKAETKMAAVPSPAQTVSEPPAKPAPAPSKPETRVASLSPAAVKPVEKPAVSLAAYPPAVMFRGGPGRDGVYKSPAREITGALKWEFAARDWIASSPVVYGGVAYFGDDGGNFYAVDVSGGGVKWRFESGGAAASPAVGYGMVYFGSTDGHLYALDAASGKIKWKHKTGAQIYSSPMAAEGRIYFGSGDGHIYALDAISGEKKWSFKTKDAVESSPAVYGDLVFSGSNDGRMYALDAASGKLKWKYGTGDYVAASPAISDGRLYFGGDDGFFHALDTKTGSDVWKFKTGDKIRSSAAVAGGMVYFGGVDGFFYALDAATGERRWVFEAEDSIRSSPAIAGDTVYFGADDKYVYALDAKSGELKWRYGTEGRVYSSPSVDGALVLVGSDGETLYALE